MEYNIIYKEELSQVYTRFIFLSFMVPLLLYFNDVEIRQDITLNIWIVGYIIVSLVHFGFLKIFPTTLSIFRRVFILGVDIAIVTVVLYYLEIDGFPFSLYYIWIIFANGMRFGHIFMIIGMVLSIAGIAILYYFSNFWHNNEHFLIFLLSSTIILPLFMLRLVYRIEEKNLEMQNLLELLHYQSLHDELTNLPNRKYLEQQLNSKVEQKGDFCFLLIDLDGFKSINDKYGHSAGDLILKKVADILRGVFKGNDFAARLGGDEFAAIVDGKYYNAVEKSEKLLKDIAIMRASTGDGGYLSASIGIACYPMDARSIEELKNLADKAMYSIKRSGKNGYAHISDIVHLDIEVKSSKY